MRPDAGSEQRSTAPVTDDNPTTEELEEDEDMPRVSPLTPRNAIVFVLFVVSAITFLYLVLPQIAGLDDTWHRIEQGEPAWMFVALGFEVLSLAAYIAMFRAICARGREDRIDWRASYEITMAGLAATRIFAAGGAGGVALTAWALRRAGFERRKVAEQMIAFLVLQYAVYMLAMVIGGFGLYVGLFHGSQEFAITMLPAILGLAVIVIVLAISFVPSDFERRLARQATRTGRSAKWARRLATGPAGMARGVRLAIELARAKDWALLATIGWWGFNIAVLWACFHAFGDPPPVAVLVVGYFVGLLGNLLPLPGGVGGVDGGMIGAFVAFGEPTGLTVVAVLAYRGFAFWLPTIPGALAYLTLRRTVAKWRAERRAVTAAA